MAKYRYKIIADKILADIRSGALLPGMTVPSSRDLSKTYQVSQLTAMHALATLAKRGILLHNRGRNYYVSQKLESSQKNYHFLTLLFRYISTDAPEFYGNRIISGIFREASLSFIGSHFTANAARTIYLHQSDFSQTLEEALMLPRQNIGFIADYYIPDEILEAIILQTGLPMVVIGRVSKLPNVHSVVLNALPAYHSMLSTLKRLGYDAFICCEIGDLSRYEYQQQKQFFQELTQQENAIDIVEYNKVPRIKQLGLLKNAIAALPGKRIAVLAPYDFIARNIIRDLETLNLKVPDQIGVVGFYGTRLATELSPKLGCLLAHPEDLGQIAAQLLISKNSHYQVHKIPMNFVFGETI